MRIGRRAFVVETIALAAFPASAATPQPRTSKIHWPGARDELHGYMAIPAKAHGAQPAILVVHDAGGADAFVLRVVDWLAATGFVACAPARLASLDDAVATVHWLASNAYATGKVAAVGFGWGGALVDRIAASPQTLLAAAITFGVEGTEALPKTPALRLEAVGHMGGPTYAEDWLRAITFLREHLT